MDPEGACIWLNEMLPKALAGAGLQICVQMTVITIGNCVPGAVLSVLFMISLNLHSMKEVLFVPMLQMRKLRLRG